VDAGALGVACAKLGEAEVMARAGVRGLLITTEVVAPAAIRRLMQLVSAAPDTLLVVDNAANVADLGREATTDGVRLDVLVDIDVGNRRTGVAPGAPALALARAVAAQPALRFRGLQGYAGHCAHVIGWEARRDASRAALAPLMETRALIEGAGLPVEITAESENWRRIRDWEGAEGWVYHSMLSGRRTALVKAKEKDDLVPLHAKPDAGAEVIAKLQSGVLGTVRYCTGKWCRIAGSGFDGFVAQERLWGVYPNEKVE